jgi:hypothetical protein
MHAGHCHCVKASFALDLYARSFVPEAHRQAVAVVDTNGNFILRLGGYGNADERGPEIRWAYARYVGVDERRLYVADGGDRRLLSIDLKYQLEKEVPLRNAGD